MELFDLQEWIRTSPAFAVGAAASILIIFYLVTRLIFGRGLTYVTSLTKNKYDDIIIKKLHPNRASILAPLILAYSFAYLAADISIIIQKITLFLILWVSILTLNNLLDAFNQVYESTPTFTGVSIQGYLDIAKILIYLVGIILSISLITDESPMLLLSGLGAITAVLLLVFHDTIMAFIASIQISAHNLIKEGDWLEVPSYSADGIVTNMTLHTIRIQNWDMTITFIPTHKIIDTAYKNWRGMQESGGRRIMRSIRLDQNTIQFCTPEMIDRYAKVNLITDFINKHQKLIDSYKANPAGLDSPLDGPQITNIEIFRAYIETYLRNHPDIHSMKMDFIVRELEPTPSGLPIEIYVFTKTTKWNDYERIQGEIIDHLLAATSFFDLRLFQEPAGSDFASIFKR